MIHVEQNVNVFKHWLFSPKRSVESKWYGVNSNLSDYCFRCSINTCRLHGSPTHHHHHHGGGGHHHHHHHGLRGIDLMDDLPLPYQDHNHHNSPMSPINLNLLSSASSTAVPNPATGGLSSAGAALLDPHSTFQTSLAGGVGGSSKTSTNVIINTATNTTTRSNLSCCNNLFLNDARAGLDSSVQLPSSTSLGGGIPDSSTAVPTVPIINTTDSGLGGSGGGSGGTDGKDKSTRHRWLTCPELHKAMDGVTYIADHTRKEEESTRVSAQHMKPTTLVVAFSPMRGGRSMPSLDRFELTRAGSL